VEEIRGIIQINRRNPTGWVTGILRGTGNKVVGVLPPDIQEGSSVVLRGDFEKHPQWGDQFRFKEVQLDLPRGQVAIVEYLDENFPRIGPSLARKLYDHFGEKLFEVVEHDQQRLTEIKTITSATAETIHSTWMTIKECFEYDKFFRECGLSPTMRTRLFIQVAKLENLEYDSDEGASVQLRHQAAQLIKTNPYYLVKLIDGIGFKTADKVALRIGFQPWDPRRIRAALLHALNEAAEHKGHTSMPHLELLSDARGLLGLDAITIEPHLSALLAEKTEVCYDLNRGLGDPNGFITLIYYFEMEKAIARKLQEIAYADVKSITAKLPKEEMDQLTDLQREAVKRCSLSPVFLLTGLPGTGKTFTLRSILNILEAEGLTVEMASPTGKAAKRMTQQTGRPARTIHRLLEYHPAHGWGRDHNNPLTCNVVILDEVSMADVLLTHRLLDAIEPGTRLILVGDPHQLPSVGPGRVFNDLIESGIAPNVHLTQIMRQAESSYIVRNAHAIHHGNDLIIDERSPEERDFHLFRRPAYDDANILVQEMLGLVAWFQQQYGYGTQDIQVLCPMNKESRAISTGALNPALRSIFNPGGRSIPGWQDAYVGDRIMQTKNNYNREMRSDSTEVEDTSSFGVFNGEIGLVEDFDETTKEVIVRWDDGRSSRYPINDAYNELKVAYAISVHKSQGSEFPVVIFCCVRSDLYMLNKNLVYTAATRASQHLVFMTQPGTDTTAIRKNDAQQRMTNLKLLLQQELT